jgi:hypothetical protein
VSSNRQTLLSEQFCDLGGRTLGNQDSSYSWHSWPRLLLVLAKLRDQRGRVNVLRIYILSQSFAGPMKWVHCYHQKYPTVPPSPLISPVVTMPALLAAVYRARSRTVGPSCSPVMGPDGNRSNFVLRARRHSSCDARGVWPAKIGDLHGFRKENLPEDCPPLLLPGMLPCLFPFCTTFSFFLSFYPSFFGLSPLLSKNARLATHLNALDILKIKLCSNKESWRRITSFFPPKCLSAGCLIWYIRQSWRSRLFVHFKL